MTDMTQTLWTLPVPATALLEGVAFQKLLGRTCTLIFKYEDEDDSIVQMSLLFEHVEAFKCTYLSACTVEMVEMAYGKVVDVGSTGWLTAVQVQADSYAASYGQDVVGLKHLMIYFDDGPCYEFICRAFHVEESSEGRQR